MKRFNYICAFAFAITGGIQCICIGQQSKVEAPSSRFAQHLVAGVEKTTNELPSNVKLYDLTNAENVYAFDTDADFIQRRSETAYPTLYKPGNASGLIVIIGYPGCGWCDPQLKLIPGQNGKMKPGEFTSTKYRVMYVHKDKADPLNEDKNAPTWDNLREKFGLKKAYPTTMIVDRGKMTKAFSGFKPWVIIQPHTEAAKKANNNDDEKPKRRRFFDFLFPPTIVSSTTVEAKPDRSRGGGDVTYFGASPTVRATPCRRP